MKYALVTDNTPAEIAGHTIETDGVQFSYETMLQWSGAERAAYSIYPITDDEIPEGKIATGSTLEFSDGVVSRHWTLEDAPPPPVPESISDRQFAHVLAVNGLISQAEALAWVTVGTVPEQVQTVVDNMPDPDIRFGAQMLLSGATIFERHHPMTEALASALGKTPEQTDALWVQGAAL